MAIKLDNNTYQCPFCNKIYSQMMLAVSCEQQHNIIYFPIVKSELDNLIKFIYTKDERLLSESFYNRLMKYRRNGNE
jgi:hypothetical protein